jgi:hypothetical protein
MDINLILISIAALLIISFWITRQRRIAKARHGEETLRPLKEVIKSAEVANDGFFRALELVQRNLEALIARAENIEERLRSATLHPGIEKREQYTAAALLLAEGQEAERVASMLSLPVAQVHLIRDLQQVTVRDKGMIPRGKQNHDTLSKELTPPSINAAPREKTAPRPILLVDAIRNATQEAIAQSQERPRFESITA